MTTELPSETAEQIQRLRTLAYANQLTPITNVRVVDSGYEKNEVKFCIFCDFRLTGQPRIRLAWGYGTQAAAACVDATLCDYRKAVSDDPALRR